MAETYKDPKYALHEAAISEILLKDLDDYTGRLLDKTYKMPPLGADSKVGSVEEIAKLTPNLENGKLKAAVCMMCHKVDAQGVNYGPNLTGWGKSRNVEEIIKDIVHPSAKIAAGFDRSYRITVGQHVAEGLISNYNIHSPGSEFAGSMSMQVFGGEMVRILFKRNTAKLEEMKGFSWMPPASKLGLSSQDVRDIAEYLKKGKVEAP